MLCIFYLNPIALQPDTTPPHTMRNNQFSSIEIGKHDRVSGWCIYMYIYLLNGVLLTIYVC